MTIAYCWKICHLWCLWWWFIIGDSISRWTLSRWPIWPRRSLNKSPMFETSRSVGSGHQPGRHWRRHTSLGSLLFTGETHPADLRKWSFQLWPEGRIPQVMGPLYAGHIQVWEIYAQVIKGLIDVLINTLVQQDAARQEVKDSIQGGTIHVQSQREYMSTLTMLSPNSS